jgi:hypothetical protein
MADQISDEILDAMIKDDTRDTPAARKPFRAGREYA